MAYAVSNGHVTDDVTWTVTQKDQSRDLVIFIPYANISKIRQFVPDRLYIVEHQSGAAEFLYTKNCKWQILEFPGIPTGISGSSNSREFPGIPGGLALRHAAWLDACVAACPAHPPARQTRRTRPSVAAASSRSRRTRPSEVVFMPKPRLLYWESANLLW